MQKPSRSKGKQIGDDNLANGGDFTTFAELVDDADKRNDVVKQRQEQ